MNQIARARILEVLVDGVSQGCIHLDVNGGVYVRKVKLDNISNKLKYTNLLHEKQNYPSIEYEDYKIMIQNGIQESFPASKILIKEKHINEKTQKLLDKQYSFTNHTH